MTFESEELAVSYTITRTIEGVRFQDVVERTRAALSDEGFGVLTEIDVKNTLKKKIGAEIDDYLILGACNPSMAYEALQMEPRVGAMLPCNVIVRTTPEGSVEVSAIDPVASMQAIPNDALKSVAAQVRDKLDKVVASI